MANWESIVAHSMERTAADIRTLCRQPSVAAQGVGIAETVQLVAGLAEMAGGWVQVLDDCGGNPIVHVEFSPGPGGARNRTLLYYNHYDVQPPDPLDAWTSPPFAPEIRDGKLFARGAADNKGDLVARLTAVRLLREHGGLPCRVKFLIEGEEEIGSPSISRAMDRHAARFAADACIWEFGDVDSRGRPQLYGGVKGMAYLQLWSRVAAVDLHSALGAVVESAGWRLVQALATLKDPEGHILIDDFAENICRPTMAVRRMTDRIPFEGNGLRQRLGLTRPLLTDGLDQDPAEALCFEPTCTICGLESGYTGPGSKTVLPRAAQAKVDCRLVPDQDPAEIFYKVRRHLERRGFRDIEVELISSQRAYLTDPSHPFVDVVRESAQQAWGGEPIYHPSSAGTGPMSPIGKALKLPIISTGCGWYGGRAHAPDESIRLSDVAKGILHQILLLERFARSI